MKGSDSLELSNIKEGMIVKNYKELCKLLNEKEKTSDSKQAQLKEWERYFKFEKKGHKYIILEIYDLPLKKKDYRIYGNNSIYIEHIEKGLLKYLSQQKGYIVELVFKNLFYPLCLVNHNYLRINKEELKKEFNLTDFEINHFYQYSYQYCKSILISSLKNLRNRSLIHYEFITMVSITRKNEKDQIITEIREATNEEKKYIISIEREVLKQMKLKNINSVYLAFKQEEFYYKINQLLSERYDIDKCFEIIRIVFNKPDILEGLKEIEVERHKKILNNKVVNAIQKKAKKNYKKNKDKIKEFNENYFGQPNPMILDKMFILSDNYLDNQYKLIDKLIRINSNDNNDNSNNDNNLK